MAEIYPVRSVLIEGVMAKVWARAPKLDDELMTVTDAESADKALGDPGNTQHCPLCNQYYGTVAFKAHAQSCINANASRWERSLEDEPSYIKTSGKSFRAKLFGSKV